MARLQTTNNPNPFGAFVEGFAGGYNFTRESVRQNQEIEREQRRLEGEKELENLMGEFGSQYQEKAVTEGPVGAIPIDDGLRGQATTTTKTSEPWTQDKWDTWGAKLAAAQAKIDPSKALRSFEDVQALQQNAILRHGQQALQKFSLGDMQGAAAALERAGSAFPDGTRWKVKTTGTGDMVLSRVDEKTGEVVSENALAPRQIYDAISSMMDPKQFMKNLHDMSMQKDRQEHDLYMQDDQQAFSERITKYTTANANARQKESIAAQWGQLWARQMFDREEGEKDRGLRERDLDQRWELAEKAAEAAGVKVSREEFKDKMKDASSLIEDVYDPAKGDLPPLLRNIPRAELDALAGELLVLNPNDYHTGSAAVHAAMDIKMFEKMGEEADAKYPEPTAGGSKSLIEYQNVVRGLSNHLQPSISVNRKTGQERVMVTLGGRRVEAPPSVAKLIRDLQAEDMALANLIARTSSGAMAGPPPVPVSAATESSRFYPQGRAVPSPSPSPSPAQLREPAIPYAGGRRNPLAP